ncbi:unnamed protein product [Moneuplotes crassus]|uniref:Uncharacterized protein n=1 Tax=Euplotes crassus TaxID=5936 RepID=A0AAD1XVF7_EUPCR|nr:unnamed protein product [Moneuplotes crassus]
MNVPKPDWAELRKRKNGFKTMQVSNKYKGIFKHKSNPYTSHPPNLLVKSVDISKKTRSKYDFVDKVITTSAETNPKNKDSGSNKSPSEMDSNSDSEKSDQISASEEFFHNDQNALMNNKLDLDRKENEIFIMMVIGNFEDDQPVKVLGMKRDQNKHFCRVQWKRRKEGVLPSPSYYPTEVIKAKCIRLLIDFYETKLQFKKKLRRYRNE